MAPVSAATQTATHELQSPPPPTTPGHGGRLRYAEPQDLPSYPSLGLRKGDAAASAAASLGWANTKPGPLWTPETSTAAHRAASLASDYKMPVPWQPDSSPVGSKTAAVLAAENAIRQDTLSSISVSVWGNSAANQAFAAGRNPPRSLDPPSAANPLTALDRQKSLRAARGAMAGSARPRSISSPITYPDSANAAANALSAATLAHRPSNAKLGDTGASPTTRMDRQMYTSDPPVKGEVDERNHEAVLHASAVAMAKKMYSTQQKMFDAARQAQEEGRSRPGSAGSDRVRPMHFNNLQEAAYKLAQERLAKLHDEHQRAKTYKDYYGAGPFSSAQGRKFTKLGKSRRRSSSDGDVVRPVADEDDRKRSRQIEKQMSLFSTRLSEVDESQRARDREALLAAARRNVKATMEGMDKKMYRETGRVNPVKLSEWELRAHATAQARSEERMGGHATGKVDIGGGQYMDREKVEEIAARRVQPLLDEMNEKAEMERKRIVALREEQEKTRLEWEAEKARNAEVKEAQRKLKDEEKARRGHLKQEVRARKEEEKAAKAEERRLARKKPDNRKAAVAIAPGASDSETPEEASDNSPEEDSPHRHRILPITPRIQTKPSSTSHPKNDPSPLSPASNASPESATGSPTSRVKNWLKSRLHKPRAKSISGNNSGGGKSSDAGGKAPGGFLGGHRLTRLHPDGTGSMTSLSEERRASMREVALAGTADEPDVASHEPGEASVCKTHGLPAAGFVISDDGGNDVVVRIDELNRSSRAPELEAVAPPKAIADPAGLGVTPRSSVGSGNRDSKFIEIID